MQKCMRCDAHLCTDEHLRNEIESMCLNSFVMFGQAKYLIWRKSKLHMNARIAAPVALQEQVFHVLVSFTLPSK